MLRDEDTDEDEEEEEEEEEEVDDGKTKPQLPASADPFDKYKRLVVGSTLKILIAGTQAELGDVLQSAARTQMIRQWAAKLEAELLRLRTWELDLPRMSSAQIDDLAENELRLNLGAS